MQTTLDETEQFNDNVLMANTDFDRSIAILPAQYPSNSKSVMVAGERKIFNEQLNSSLKQHYTGYVINSSDFTMNVINESNLTGEYSVLINDYRNTGILSKTKIEKMSNALKARYILYTEYIDLDSKTQVVLLGQGAFGSDVKSDIGVKDVIMSYQLWDSKYSKPVFETIVSTGTLQSNIKNNEMPFTELISKNVTAFAKEIKNQNGQSICPECPKSRIEYNNEIQSAHSGNYMLGIGLGTLGVCFIILLLGAAGAK